MDCRISFDRPREAAATPDTPNNSAELWALAQRLEGQCFDVEHSAQTLVVHNPQGGQPSITVVCRPRSDDGGRLWFLTSSGRPITEADRIIDAALIIRSLLDRNLSDRAKQDSFGDEGPDSQKPL